jgi:hypothetical protein
LKGRNEESQCVEDVKERDVKIVGKVVAVQREEKEDKNLNIKYVHDQDNELQDKVEFPLLTVLLEV